MKSVKYYVYAFFCLCRERLGQYMKQETQRGWKVICGKGVTGWNWTQATSLRTTASVHGSRNITTWPSQHPMNSELLCKICIVDFTPWDEVQQKYKSDYNVSTLNCPVVGSCYSYATNFKCTQVNTCLVVSITNTWENISNNSHEIKLSQGMSPTGIDY